MQWRLSSASWIRFAALTAVCTVGALGEVVRQTCLTSLNNGDFWWHLRVGLGIVATHTLPRTSVYSQAASLPWMASSWLFDVAIAVGYKVFDLSVVLIAAILFRLLLGILVFLLAGGLRGRFWKAVCLSLIGQYLLASMQPLPIYFSVLALSIELLLLIRSRQSGDLKFFYWLPLLFLLWANVDANFVLGIVVLLLLLLSSALLRGTSYDGSSLPMNQLSVITGAVILASFITPYGWRPYSLFFGQATSPANAYFADMQALRFRTPQDYVLMLLIMSAFLVLGLRRSRDPFTIGLLVLCTALAFRSQIDSWLAVLSSIAVLGDYVSAGQESSAELPKSQLVLAGLCAVAVLMFSGRALLPHGHEAILAKLSKSYPVSAASYVRNTRLPQPLFNPFPWGGFLAWYLPEYPVAIDGRTDLYGSDFNIQYARTMNVEQHYSAFAPLNNASTLILQKDSLIGQALPAARGFKAAYSDDVAVVLLREDR